MRQPGSRLGCRRQYAPLSGILCLLLVVTAYHVTAYHASSDAGGSSPSTGKPPPEAARLESVLYELTQADDMDAVARQRNIPISNGMVRVVVELREGRRLPEHPGVTVEASYKDLVRVRVPVSELLALSQGEDVSYVRLSDTLLPAE